MMTVQLGWIGDKLKQAVRFIFFLTYVDEHTRNIIFEACEEKLSSR